MKWEIDYEILCTDLGEEHLKYARPQKRKNSTNGNEYNSKEEQNQVSNTHVSFHSYFLL